MTIITNPASSDEKTTLRKLPRNAWAVIFTCFFMDVSSEMVLSTYTAVLGNLDFPASLTAAGLTLTWMPKAIPQHTV